MNVCPFTPKTMYDNIYSQLILVDQDKQLSVTSDEGINLPLIWKVHPFRESRLKSTAVIVVFISIGILVYYSFHEILFVILAITMLGCSLVRYFLPTEYKIDDTGIQIKFLGKTQKHKWMEFKTYYICRNGIQLSTFPKPSRLDSFRGHFLLPGKNKEEIIAYLRIILSESK